MISSHPYVSSRYAFVLMTTLNRKAMQTRDATGTTNLSMTEAHLSSFQRTADRSSVKEGRTRAGSHMQAASRALQPVEENDSEEGLKKKDAAETEIQVEARSPGPWRDVNSPSVQD